MRFINNSNRVYNGYGKCYFISNSNHVLKGNSGKLAVSFLTWPSNNVFGCTCYQIYVAIWGLCCQTQVSQAGVSSFIPRFTVGCNYLSLPDIPAPDKKSTYIIITFWSVQGLSGIIWTALMQHMSCPRQSTMLNVPHLVMLKDVTGRWHTRELQYHKYGRCKKGVYYMPGPAFTKIDQCTS